MNSGLLYKLIGNRFGVATRSRENPLITSVGTSAAVVLGNNPNRLGFLILNLSANTMYLSPSADVSSTKGIRLGSSGGQAFMVYDEDFDLVGREFYIVADGAASALYVIEIEGTAEVTP